MQSISSIYEKSKNLYIPYIQKINLYIFKIYKSNI